jgi:archaellum biogenesis ATPase FlaH
MTGLNEQTILKWWEIFKGEHPLTEVRILDGANSYSGYFNDVHKMIDALRPYADKAIYGIINIVNDDCLGRKQAGRIIRISKDEATGDNIITGRTMILIDLDPVRISGVNATDEEKGYARKTMCAIGSFLKAQGFSTPVVADSGNGYHMYYRVKLQNTPENTQLVKDFLGVISDQFSSDKCDVDTSVFNAARITKLIGTTSRKGTDTSERPQRESRFVKVPERWEFTDISYIRKVAAMKPQPEAQTAQNDFGRKKFDIEAFFTEHNIKVKSREPYNGGIRYILDECPWDSTHKDAAVIQRTDGTLCYHCFHNSCSQYGWKEYRLFYEPNAYSQADLSAYEFKRDYNDRRRGRGNLSDLFKHEVTSDLGPVWMKASEVKWEDPRNAIYVPTGITRLDNKIRGLGVPGVTVLSGLSGCGKSTLIDELILSALQAGFPTAAFSGELPGALFMQWLRQIAAGPAVTKVWRGEELAYCYADREVSEKIDRWLDSKYFFLYNNDYGSKWSKLFPSIRDAVEKKGAKIIFVDNLMIMDLDFEGEKNDLQGQLIKQMMDYAKAKRVHILLVAHPRKETQAKLLRMQDISGTADLYNVPDNVFLLHRVNTDFEKRAIDFWGRKRLDDIQLAGYSTILEVAKCRSNGTANEMLCGLFFNEVDRRLENERNEDHDYGWQEYSEPQVPFNNEFDPGDDGDLPY